jgi:poly(hydroxyalkanoate) granule-associated protein
MRRYVIILLDALRHKVLLLNSLLNLFKEINMEPKEKPIEEDAEERESYPLIDATRKIILAAIGAVALGKDEAEDFVNKLVDRGEIAEKDGRKLINEVIEKRKKTGKAGEVRVGKHVLDILDRLNVPTKKDIDDLSEKVASLAKKVDELTKTKS